MKNLYISPPRLLKKIAGGTYWNSGIKKLLLTFDDGPHPSGTQKILRQLEDYNIKCLFFCVGCRILKYGSLVNEILSCGHSIGNHSLNHLSMFNLNGSAVMREIASVNTMLAERYNYRAAYFRPPFGKFNFKVLRVLKNTGLRNVMWSLMPLDFVLNIEEVRNNIRKYLKSDSIIVLHDSTPALRNIPASIDFLVEHAAGNGYKFGRAEECLN